MARRLSTTEDYRSLLDDFDNWMFDCDGVLWHGNTLIDGASDVLSLLRSRKKNIIFVTNNATQSRKSYKQKFDKLGLQADADEIFGSAYAAAVYLSTVIMFPKDEKVYVIGMSGLEDELREEGVAFLGGTAPEDNTLEPFSVRSFKPDPSVSAVLCGLDTSINYTKLSKAFIYLTQKRDKECLFLATNSDSTYPAGAGGIFLPGAGAMQAPLSLALGKTPLSIGKPNSTMLDTIRAKHNFDPSRTIMVGDRLDTDILFGKNGGVSTLLVLTGVATEQDLEGPKASTIVPDYVAPSIGNLRAAQ